MVPPLFLDVHPNHFVLDMCAAPGSKTFQLLEIINRANEPGSLPSGMVVANDVDIQRSNLLIHQTKRMCTANLIVTNHEAQDFPGCRLSKFHQNSSDVQSAKGLSIDQLLFDRVLCDVRDKGLWLSSYKDVSEFRRPGILSSYFPSGGKDTDSSESSGSHETTEARVDDGNVDAVQPTILNDGSSSVVNDGEVSSLPLERCMRIVPHDQNCGAFFIAVFHKHSAIPVVQEKNGGANEQLLQTKEESLEAATEHASNLDDALEAKLCDATSIDSVEIEASPLDNEPSKNLEDEGPENQQDLGNKEADAEKVGVKRKLHVQGKWKGIDPVILFREEIVINSIKGFYGIDDSFPLDGHLVTRNSDTDSVKRIYYISKSVKDVLELNLLAGQQLKMASVGLKMFERQTSKDGSATACRYRISSEGLPLLLPYITKQIIHAPLADFKHLLQYKSIKFGDLVDAELAEKATKLELGCCVVVLKEAQQASSVPVQVDSSAVAIGCWKGRANLNVMLTALDCQDLLERLEKRMATDNAQTTEPQTSGVNRASSLNDTDMKEESKSDTDLKEESKNDTDLKKECKNDIEMKEEETVNMVGLVMKSQNEGDER
ncbi:Multisite-specific tRNA:(cytosine-C(5))-methyltransferase [Bienertia sinuspersici]